MPTPKSATIEARKVSLNYGGQRVLHKVDLTIGAGEFFCLLGPSGAGKTSFLKLVAGLLSPTAGELLIDGTPALARPAHQRGVGMLFQGLGLWPHMTARETVGYGLLRQNLAKGEIERRADAMLELVGLAGEAGKYPDEISGGQQQKLALARALVVEPRILLLDQPLSALDQAFRAHLRDDIAHLQRTLGITTIMVTHDPEEALAMADRLAVIRDGRILQVGSPAALHDYPVNTFVAEALGTANLITGVVESGFPDAGALARFVSPVTGPVPVLDALRAPATGPVVACFRPASVLLLPYDSQARDAGRVWMNGRIARSEFRGAYVRYRVKVGENYVMCDLPHRTGALALAAGSEVLIGVDSSQIRFMNA